MCQPLRPVRAMFAIFAVGFLTATVFPNDAIRTDSLADWRQPAEGWAVVGDVRLDQEDPERLAASSGSGVVFVDEAGKSDYLLSKREYGDIEFHVEFNIPKGSNSGVYFMGRYEIQIYDSEGVERADYPGMECGGIYPRHSESRGEYEGHSPRVNASLAPGQWQSFDVIFRAPKFDGDGNKISNARFERVVHNGKVIHEQIEVKGMTRAGMSEREVAVGPIRLQGDHGPVAFRNVRIRRLGEPTDIFAANRRLGRGINLGNFLEVPRKEDWGVAIEHEHLRLIKQAGFDSIRVPVKWSDYAAKESPYLIEPQFFARVDGWLDRAEREQLNVVLNIHHYYDLDLDPEGHAERFEAIWRQIAERYESRGRWLYFELDNEPHEELSEQWNDILLRGLSAVRATNPERPVIVGPPHWNGIWALPQLELPKDPNLIVTVHMYNPHEFTHQGASWANEEVRAIRGRGWGSPEEQRSLNEEIGKAAEWGKQHHRPIFLGEFGAFQAAPMESRLRWTAAVVQAAREHQMSWAYWEFAAGFGVFDPDRGKWREDLLKALLNPKQ